MQTFKNLVLIACVIGIADKIISIICGDKYSSQLRLITALVMIMSIGSQIKGGISLPDTSYYESELEYAEERTREEYLDSIEETMAQRIKDIYLQEGIELDNVGIAISFDEYKYISVDEITLYTHSTETEDKELKKILSVYFPDTEINVIR